MVENRLINNPYYVLLTRRLSLLLIVVSVTPMILVSGFILDQFSKSYQEKVLAHLEVLIRKHKQNIDTFLREKLADIRFLSVSMTIGQLKNQDILNDELKKLQGEFGFVFEDIGIVDDQGVQVTYAGPYGQLIRAQYSEADWFKKAIENEFFISDVFTGLRGLPHFIISVTKEWEGRKWILRATIDFHAFNSLVEKLRIGKTGFAFILNREGKFQTKPSMNEVPSEELIGLGPKDVDYLSKFFMSGRETKDKVYIVEKKNTKGKEIIYVGAFLKDGDWILIFQQEAADAYSDLKKAQYIAFIIMVLGGLGIVITAIVVSKGMVEKIARADREKEMMNQQVIETGKLASIGELAAGIAHEINNPIAIMVEEAGWIQDLLEEEEFKQSQNLQEFYRALKQIQTQGKRCKEITHNLLRFARKADSKTQIVQLNDVVEEVTSLSAKRAKYANITINKHLDPNLPTIQVSHTEIQQVFMNLLNNALDAMEKTGGKIDITTRVEGNNIVIDFSDNGPGIPRANLGRIFDPFFTTKPVGKGTGLGLSICYGIIKKMGGSIDVKSVVDSGTTFQVRIPIDKNQIIAENPNETHFETSTK